MSVPVQPRLGFIRTLQITLEGLRYRLFRSLLLVVSIAVAVGFVMNTVAESLVLRDLARFRAGVLADKRELSHENDRWLSPPSEEELLHELASAKHTAAAWIEARHFGRLSAAELEGLHAGLPRAAEFTVFIDGLNPTQRLVLAGGTRGIGTLDLLQGTTAREKFVHGLADFRGLALPWTSEAFEEMIASWPRTHALLRRIHAGREAAARTVSRGLESAPVTALASDPAAAAETVRTAGFILSDEKLARLTATARRMVRMRDLEEALRVPAIRQAVAERAGVAAPALKTDDFWEVLAADEELESFQAHLETYRLPAAAFGLADVRELASKRRLELRVEDGAAAANAGDSDALLATRTAWLLGFALLVCAVGVVNAMLMAVVERYREIATLKCLGALDRFILGSFFAEGCLLGLAGGVAGALLGGALGFGRMWAKFPLLTPAALDVGLFLQAMLAAAAVGIALAALAALYPAWRAARLAPMEAMRIE